MVRVGPRVGAASRPEEVVERIRPGLVGGAIVLLHDSDATSPPGSAALALEALGPIAEVLHRRGLAATTLDALVSGDPASGG